MIEGIESAPGSDELKHMGAAMASYGSVPLFHVVGVTPEAPTLKDVCDPSALEAEIVCRRHGTVFRTLRRQG